MPASFGNLEKEKAKVEVQEVNLFGHAQKNVELMKDILQATQEKLGNIYAALAQSKKQEKTRVKLIESVGAPVEKPSAKSVAALADIHTLATKHNEKAKKVEARLMFLVGNNVPSNNYKNEMQITLEFYNEQNEALAKLQKKLAELTLLTPVKVSDDMSSKLKQMYSLVKEQLKELQERNKHLKDNIAAAKQVKTAANEPESHSKRKPQ